MTRLILGVLTTAILTACGSSNTPATEKSTKQTSETNQEPIVGYHVISDSVLQVALTTDTSQSYALYIPSTIDTLDIPHTIILFCDPHGAGRLPIDKYRKLADRFGIALAGSNNSRNGLSPEQCAGYVENIINDLHSRLHYEKPDICLAGFSGGSKVALQAAMNNININNVIYAGAIRPFQATQPVRLLGFAGTSDMNYSDLLAFADALPQGTGALIEYDGKHAWPPATVYQKAFYWLAFRQSKHRGSPIMEVLEMEYENLVNAEAMAATKQNNKLAEVEKFREGIFIEGEDANPIDFQGNVDAIIKEELYKKQLAQKANMLKSESEQKKVLMAAFQNQDVPWWSQTIAQLRSSSSPTDKRLMGFISLACYSYTSQCIARGDVANAGHFAAIYELADPDNTDQLYFHAVLAGKKNDNAQALKYMQKAVKNGFADWQKADGEPALTTARGAGSFSRLQAASKTGSK